MKMLRFLAIFAAIAFVLSFVVAGVAQAADVPVPAKGGFFVYDKGELTELTKQFTKKKEMDGKEYVGWSDKGVEWKTFSEDAIFILNDARVAHTDSSFRKLIFEGVRTKDGQEFKSENFQLNMWIRDTKVMTSLNEHPQKAGVWIMTPDPKLKPGHYGVYFGESLNKAREHEVPEVFNFIIK